MRKRRIVFLVNLLQDVNILRPLALLAAQDLGVAVTFLVSYKFMQRDKPSRIWQRELAALAGSIGATVEIYSSLGEALAYLRGRSGMIIAGSESNLSAHAETHDVLLAAPKTFTTVTLQHGFECIGFLQNREHDKAHGTKVVFGAEIVCGWFDVGRMTSMAPSQRSKLYVTGPGSVLQMPERAEPEVRGGLVCENLHSVRLRASGDFTKSFMEVFSEFCGHQARDDRTIFLRPHPGGQYVIRNNISLPENVRLANNPIYATDLSQFDFGISAPSSILIDMVLSGIPAGVWSDGDGIMDTSHYDGLTQISGIEDWLAFAHAAVTDRAPILDRQQAFLDRWRMPTAPDEVRGRFLKLMAGMASQPIRLQPPRRPIRKVLIIANGNVPTVQICFTNPLSDLADSGSLVLELLTESTLGEREGEVLDAAIRQLMLEFAPDIVVLCRYSGRGYETIFHTANELSCPVIYHLDDDLLNIPPEIGEDKYLWHNRPERLASVRYSLGNADLIYASTPELKAHLDTQAFGPPIVAGKINCPGRIVARPENRSVRKIGYMGFGHGNDLATILQPLIRFLRLHPEISFELFGTIPKPPELEEFGDRVAEFSPTRNYDDFIARLAELEWDIGICPLQDLPFNRLKSNNKWVEYTSVGCATVASRGTVYDRCCADGAGLLVEGDTEWFDALEMLAAQPGLRYDMVVTAQQVLERDYSEDHLRHQILDVFVEAQKTLEASQKAASKQSAAAE